MNGTGPTRVRGLRDHEQELTTALAAWAVASVVKGLALGAIARRGDHEVMAGFARQMVGWGLVDGAIAGVGLWRSRARRDEPVDTLREDAEQARLHRLLVLNSALDVGYVLAGAGLAVGAERASRPPRYSAGAARGDGLGIVVQGAFLLGLDAVFAARTRRR
jgi:hypothetical protein